VNSIALVSLLGLLFIWLGYPIGVAALAKLRGRNARANGPCSETVSVILATRASPAAIRARIENLLGASLDPGKIEFIVGIDAANGSASIEQLGGLDRRVKVVLGDAPGGKAPTLNAAVRAARHDVLVIADTAQSFDRDAIKELLTVLADPSLGAVSGMLDVPARHRSATLAERYWRYERWLRSAEAQLNSAIGVTGAIYAMRRALWRPLPPDLILDDLYIPMRLVLDRWRIGFATRARATDSRRFTPVEEYRRKVRTLTGVIQLCVWLPQVLNPFRNPVWIQFICHKLLRLLTPYLITACSLALIWRLGAAIYSAQTKLPVIAVAVALAGLLSVPSARRIFATQFKWGLILQASIVVATINGIRGHWDVWRT
jgi:cellulose synthase/poly-beta-1,6-N-acetylglucosamine synthase-like glycosyltransferase